MKRPTFQPSRYLVRAEAGYEKTPLLNLQADVADGVAKMRLYDPIDSCGDPYGVSAKEVAVALDALPDDVTDIHLHINSPGGEVFEGIAIMNLLRGHPASVTAIVDGIAASAASFIAASADTVVMARNTELMVHDAFGLCLGDARDMAKMGDTLDHLSDNIASVYAEKSGGTVEAWRAVMLAETWYSADEAVAAGLADRVEKGQPKAANAFDLSVFTYAGRGEAPAPATVPPVPEPAPHPTPAPEPAPMSNLMEIRHRINERKAS